MNKIKNFFFKQKQNSCLEGIKCSANLQIIFNKRS